ncbi:MAG: CpsB/CapC family capsule biosynthesis tyrosine phosphatase [Pirellulaceae bacterium]|nr:hypothetical protein [Planctomycetales bacterium]
MYADTHFHLCPGLDDGPRDLDVALQLCHLAWNEGTRAIAALAHQSDMFADVTPPQIRSAVADVETALRDMDIPLKLVPTAEVMVTPDVVERWQAGELLTYGDANKYILLEYPHGLYVDLRDVAADFIEAGVRPVIAHAERQPELLYQFEEICELIQIGCVIQVSTRSLTDSTSAQQTRALKQWAERGVIHCLGSDAHSPHRRPPTMAAAVDTLSRWTSASEALLIARDNGMAILDGQPLRLGAPKPPRRRSWFNFR